MVSEGGLYPPRVDLYNPERSEGCNIDPRGKLCFWEKLINVGTRLPLIVSETQSWVYDEVKNTISDLKDSSKCLDRGWGQSDGINIALWGKWEGVTQQFSISILVSLYAFFLILRF